MSAPALQATDPVRETSHVPPPYDLIELLFFAYRDFVGEADLVLASYGFGRAHHRVLHFVDRLPGLTIAELLDILRITKQSLNRVLRDLVEAGFIEQRAGVSDRRRRLLVTTKLGETLARELARVQSARIAKGLTQAGLAETGDDTRETVLRFLAGMVGEGDRDHVLELVARGRINGPHL
ncbi:DNA-binding transcriptional regulator, MarR family [Rhizobiales bacterium GAS191]|nr:DNA-binding transcriptional regulator, MarR family [Rhizobiales bacterium GAS113]SEE87171.1 DNA-binding transcriptional regulator, MarR family [Rhizobiales bacterium GAS191]